MAWADVKMVMRYITGYAGIGRMEYTGVLREVPYDECPSKEEFLSDDDVAGLPPVRQTQASRHLLHTASHMHSSPQ